MAELSERQMMDIAIGRLTAILSTMNGRIVRDERRPGLLIVTAEIFYGERITEQPPIRSPK